MQNLTLETHIQAKPDIICNMIDKEIVMMSPETRIYIGLNPIGSEIWQYLQKGIAFENLVQLFFQKYDISKLECERKISTFILKLQENALVTLKES